MRGGHKAGGREEERCRVARKTEITASRDEYQQGLNCTHRKWNISAALRRRWAFVVARREEVPVLSERSRGGARGSGRAGPVLQSRARCRAGGSTSLRWDAEQETPITPWYAPLCYPSTAWGIPASHALLPVCNPV